MPLSLTLSTTSLVPQDDLGKNYKPAIVITSADFVDNTTLDSVRIVLEDPSGSEISDYIVDDTQALREFANNVNSSIPNYIVKSNISPLNFFGQLVDTINITVTVNQIGSIKSEVSGNIALKGGPPSSSQTFVDYLEQVFEEEFDWDSDDIYDYVTSGSFWGTSDNAGSYFGGSVESWYDEYIDMSGTEPEPSPESVVEELTGEILGCVITQNSITQTHGFATLDDGSCEPACNNVSATILNSQIQEWGQPYIDLLDNDQINCLVDEGYGDPTVGNEPDPVYTFDQEVPADDFVDSLSLDCLPDDWEGLFSAWWLSNSDSYEFTDSNNGYGDAGVGVQMAGAMIDIYLEGAYDGCNYGCTDSTANNYNSNADIEDDSCEYTQEVYDVVGCTDSEATNYNSSATVDDGSCEYVQEVVNVLGCTDNSANNYNPNATVNDGSCEYNIEGCTDSSANNYNSSANTDNGSCTYDVQGCTDSEANNYLPEATVNDGSCQYTQGPIRRVYRNKCIQL